MSETMTTAQTERAAARIIRTGRKAIKKSNTEKTSYFLRDIDAAMFRAFKAVCALEGLTVRAGLEKVMAEKVRQS